MVGKRVRVETHAGVQGEGIVERVMGSRFGQLAHVEGVGEPDKFVAWRITDCKEVE